MQESQELSQVSEYAKPKEDPKLVKSYTLRTSKAK